MARSTPLFLLRLLLIVATFLFVAQQLSIFSFLHWFSDNLFFYIVIPLASAATLFVTWRLYPTICPAAKSLLISFFPVAFLFTLGLSFSQHFHYFIPFSVGLYAIAVFAFLACAFVKRERDQFAPSEALPRILAPFSWREKNNRPAILFIMVVTLAFFGFGLHNLTHFAAVDEPLWLDGRIGKFWKYLSEQKMDKTLVSDKPGITIVLASGPGLFFVEPKNYRDTRQDFQAKNADNSIEDLYLAFRLPLLIVITALLPFFYILLVPLVGTLPALFAYTGIALAPVLIGMSKIVNPDALLWLFAPLSFLSYLVFLEKRAWRFLLLSGIFFGFALLTKYVANFLVVYLFALSFLFPLWKQDTPFSLRFLFQAFLTWFGTGIAILYLFVPLFWVNPPALLASTIFSQAFEKVAWVFIVLITFAFTDQFFLKSRFSTWFITTLKKWNQVIKKILLGIFILALLATLLNGLFGMPWVDFGRILDSPKTTARSHSIVAIFLTHFYPLVFGSAPLILLGATVLIWKTWWNNFRTFPFLERLPLSIILFILLYYVGSTVNEVVLINRYQIMLYPLLAILGGLGLFVLMKTLRIPKKPAFSLSVKQGFPFLIGTTLLLALSPLLTPLPLSYSSTLLPKEFSIDHKDMGAGSYEVAEYLNTLPQAKETAIWTDKSGVCKFYVGPCLDGFNFQKLNEYQVQYIVLSSGRASRTHTRFSPQSNLLEDAHLIRFDTYYDHTDPIFTFEVNGRSSQTVKVFRLNP